MTYDVISGRRDLECASKRFTVVDGNHLISGGDSDHRRIYKHVVAESTSRHPLDGDSLSTIGNIHDGAAADRL